MGGQSLNRTLARFFGHASGTETERPRITLGIILLKDVKKRLTGENTAVGNQFSAPGAHRRNVIHRVEIATSASFFVGAIIDLDEMLQLFNFDKSRFQAGARI